jgi:hypothetical protein
MLRKSAVLLAAIGVAFGVFEIGSRIWLRHFTSEETFSRYASLAQQIERSAATGASPFKYVPHPYVGYVPAPSYVRGRNRHNDRGFRGGPIAVPKPEGEFRIACLGGSTTYSSFIEDADRSYPSLLETVLRERGQETVRVINAGAEGYSSWESLVNLEFRVLDLEPDLILYYEAVNDLFTRIVWPPWAYRGDNSGSFVDSGNFYRSPPFLDRSTLFRILRVRLGGPSPSALSSTHVEFAPTAYAWPFVFQAQAGTYPHGIFETVDVEEMLRKNPPIYFERNLRNLVAVARESRAQPVFATFAHSNRVVDPPLDSPLMEAALEEMNGVLERVSSDLAVPLFDFAAVFPDDPSLYVGAVHLTEEGALLQAKMFADFLESAGLLPGTP